VHTGDDPATWANYHNIYTVTDTDDLTAARIASWEDDYDTSSLVFNGTCANDAVGYGYLAFGERQFLLDIDGPNEWLWYATPSSVGGQAFNSSFTVASAGGNYTRATMADYGLFTDAQRLLLFAAGYGNETLFGNFSVYVGINSTEIGKAAYQTFYDYAWATQVRFGLVLNTNATINSTTFTCTNAASTGWIRAAYNTTALVFWATSIQSYSVPTFSWTSTAGDTTLTDIVLVQSPIYDGSDSILATIL
jgi:hypothetical protein